MSQRQSRITEEIFNFYKPLIEMCISKNPRFSQQQIYETVIRYAPPDMKVSKATVSIMIKAKDYTEYLAIKDRYQESKRRAQEERERGAETDVAEETENACEENTHAADAVADGIAELRTVEISQANLLNKLLDELRFTNRLVLKLLKDYGTDLSDIEGGKGE